MSRFEQGLSIEALRERYAEDVATRTPDELDALYGRDMPRFMGADPEHRFRPTSVHLRSGMYADAQGRVYTPVREPTSDEWWVRIPPTRLRADQAPLEFPEPDEWLELRYAEGGGADGPAVLRAQVHQLIRTRATSSAVVVFSRPIDSTRPAAQQSRLEARGQREFARRMAAAEADRRYPDADTGSRPPAPPPPQRRRRPYI